jgi:hypothetical protein
VAHARPCCRARKSGTPEDVPRTVTELTMRTMFLIWTTLIVGGIVYFSVVGLTHG